MYLLKIKLGSANFFTKSLSGSWKLSKNLVSSIDSHNDLGASLTSGGQSNYILKVEGQEAFIAVLDINKPNRPYARVIAAARVDL